MLQVDKFWALLNASFTVSEGRGKNGKEMLHTQWRGKFRRSKFPWKVRKCSTYTRARERQVSRHNAFEEFALPGWTWYNFIQHSGASLLQLLGHGHTLDRDSSSRLTLAKCFALCFAWSFPHLFFSTRLDDSIHRSSCAARRKWDKQFQVLEIFSGGGANVAGFSSSFFFCFFNRY